MRKIIAPSLTLPLVLLSCSPQPALNAPAPTAPISTQRTPSPPATGNTGTPTGTQTPPADQARRPQPAPAQTRQGELDLTELTALVGNSVEQAELFIHGQRIAIQEGRFQFSQTPNSPSLGLLSLPNGTLLMHLFSGQEDEKLGVSSTAASHILLQPGFLTLDPQLLAQRKTLLQSLPAFTAQVEALQRWLAAPKSTELANLYQQRQQQTIEALAQALEPKHGTNGFQTQNSRFLLFTDPLTLEYSRYSSLNLSLPGDPLFGGLVRDVLGAKYEVEANKDSSFTMGFANFLSIGHVGRISALKSGDIRRPNTWERVPIAYSGSGKTAWNDDKGIKLFPFTSPYILFYPAELKSGIKDLFEGVLEVAQTGVLADMSAGIGHSVNYTSFDLDAGQTLEDVLSYSQVKRETRYLNESLNSLGNEANTGYPVEFLQTHTRYALETQTGLQILPRFGEINMNAADAEMTLYGAGFNLLIHLSKLVSLLIGDQKPFEELITSALTDKDAILTLVKVLQSDHPDLFNALSQGDYHAALGALVLSYEKMATISNAFIAAFIDEGLDEAMKRSAEYALEGIFGMSVQEALKQYALSPSLTTALIEKKGQAFFHGLSWGKQMALEKQSDGHFYQVFSLKRSYPLPSIVDVTQNGAKAAFKILYYNQTGQHASTLFLGDTPVPLTHSAVTVTPLSTSGTGYEHVAVELDLSQFPLTGTNHTLKVSNNGYQSAYGETSLTRVSSATPPDTQAPVSGNTQTPDPETTPHTEPVITGERLVFLRTDSRFYAAKPDGSITAKITITETTPFRNQKLVVSPNGRYVAFVSSGKLSIYDLSGKEVSTHNNFLGQMPIWRPDSQALMAFRAAPGGGTHIVRVGINGSEEAPLEPAAHTNAWPTWSPDGQHIAYFDRQQRIHKAPTSGTTAQTLSPTLSFANGQILWSGSGQWLSYLTTGGSNGLNPLWVMRADGSEARQIDSSDGLWTFSATGDLLTYTKNDVFYTDVSTNTAPVRVTQQGLYPDAVIWTPQNTHLSFFQNRQLYLLPLTGTLPVTPQFISGSGHQIPLQNAALDRDGQRMAYVTQNGLFVVDYQGQVKQVTQFEDRVGMFTSLGQINQNPIWVKE